MKNRTNSFLAAVMAVLMMVAVAGCKDGKRELLRQEVEKVNKTCPINIGGLISIKSIEYVDNAVVYKMGVNEQMVNVAGLKKVPEVVKDNVILSLAHGNAEQQSLMRTLVACESPLRFVVEGETSGEGFEVTMAPNEINQALKQKLSAEEMNRRMLDNQIKLTKVQLPMDMGGITLVDFKKEGSYLAYVYEVDDSEKALGALIGDPKALAENQKKALKQMSQPLKESMRPMAACNMGLIYRYVGKTSGKTVETRIDPTDLQEALTEEQK